MQHPAGFLASAAALVGCCAYSVITGLLVAEVNLNIMREQGAGGVSLVTMAQATLGQRAASVVSVLYIFQHYSLLVAYISRSGEILSQDTGLPSPLACTLFAVPLGLACYALPGRQLDALNNSLVAGVVAVFMALVLLVLPGVQPDTLWVANWGAVPHTLPVMALAFVYQNVVPVVVKELEGDPGKVGLRASGPQGSESRAAGWLLMGTMPEGPWRLALATVPMRQLTYALTVLPPLLMACTSPQLFYAALDLAGTYGVMTLFGMLPAAMAWSQRLPRSQSRPATHTRLMAGGNAVLIGVGAIALAVIFNEVVG
ncbi:uncharacterized protein HaLaN_14951 [Haematococcus lacustris]|uniref:Aa_trans domain-containing protein n=1 Tax=Haematococcus lacustris TaxID=44745 RepID=A0A699ZQI8_HAELA|nr:uncharacterized protein HaLaN_14951 [Haematococcus lacustris]